MKQTIYLAPPPDTFSGEWLDEEAAWIVCELQGWVASPMLLMWLKRYVQETNAARISEQAAGDDEATP